MSKTDIHPTQFTVPVECSCGNKFNILSTRQVKLLNVEVCNECHPFYTGKFKAVDTAGRIDAFMRKYQ